MNETIEKKNWKLAVNNDKQMNSTVKMACKYLISSIAVVCIGCARTHPSPKERSYSTAVGILESIREKDVFERVSSLDDVDALRFIQGMGSRGITLKNDRTTDDCV